MAGHIRRLDNERYLVRVSAGRDPRTGRRLQPSRVIRGTRQEAEVELARLRLEHGQPNTPQSGTTLNQLVELFLSAPTRSGTRREPSSQYRERRRYESHVQPMFGQRVASDISAPELTMLYDSLIVDGLSPASVRLVHGLVQAAFAWGEKRGHVRSNPAKLAECPTVRPQPPSAPSIETVWVHLEILQEADPDLALTVRLAATIGLRRNEIAGLRWEHIDLTNGLVSISEGVIVTPGEGATVTETKTGQHGHGVLSIDGGLASMLQDAQERLEKVAADLGEEVSSDAYVFSSDPLHGKPINPDTLTKRLWAHMDRHSEIPSFTLKDLRAFTATELEASGADVTTAQAVLRHQSSQTTLRHYRAALTSRVREATATLGQRLDEFNTP